MSPHLDMFYACSPSASVHLLLPLASSWWTSPSFINLKLVRRLLLDFCSSCSRLLQGEENKRQLGSTGDRKRQCSVLLGKVWEWKNPFCYQGRRLGDLCQQTLPPQQWLPSVVVICNWWQRYILLSTCQHITALIKLPTPKVNWLCTENIPFYNWRHWIQEIGCQKSNNPTYGLIECFIIFKRHDNWCELLYQISELPAPNTSMWPGLVKQGTLPEFN